jgi:VWFA-related protein
VRPSRSFPSRLSSCLGRAIVAIAIAQLLPLPAFSIEPAPADPAWVEYASALLTPEEVETLNGLEQQYERREFVDRFWESRDPDLSTTRNELREQWPLRIGSAESDFGGLTSDRARAFLLKGPPKYMLKELCTQQLRPVEVWVYENDEGDDSDGEGAAVFFSGADDTFALWDPDQHSVADLLLRSMPTPAAAARYLTKECRRGGEISAILAQALSPSSVFAPSTGGNWLTSFRQEVLGVSREKLDCAIDFAFPGQSRNQTVVDGQLTVRDAPDKKGAATSFILDGDVFRGSHRADSFRYRFDSPQKEPAGGVERFGFRRHLAPGAYRVLLTVRSSDGQSIFHAETDLQVPTVGADSGNREEPRTLPSEKATLKVQPLPLGLLTGRQRVDVITSGEGIASVVFLLDNRRVMKKSRPPFSVELDLGERPRIHTLEVVGHDKNGREIGRDLVPINVGPHRFAVRLVEPRQGHPYSKALAVHADVNVPPGDKLDRVELFFNEDRLATLYQAPFVHPNLELPSRHATGYVRAVAVLDDGNSADDLVVINTGSTVDQMQVDFVELYASALDRKGVPVAGLSRDDFSVVEDGVEQTIRRFETVSDLPINAGIVLDTSISMIEELDDAEDAALQFFENVIQPKDRAAIVVFSDQPELRVPLTNSHSRLAAGLDGIEAGGETTLYDSVVFGLYYMVGLRGKRALILLTDGVDSQSKYSFEDTLEFAQFSGVAVYSIGIGISRNDHEAQRVLRGLASQTGGDCYFIDSARELKRIYAKIESELRSQYLIGYQSTQSSSEDFRRIEIRTSRPHLEVKTVPGYYP